jgi:hypothetical protein
MSINNSCNLNVFFHAYMATDADAVTGDGSTSFMFQGAQTTINQGNAYNTSTGVFTAPLTANYQLAFLFSLSNSVGFDEVIVTLATTAHNYSSWGYTVNQSNTNAFCSGIISVPMSAGQTASVSIVVTDGSSMNMTNVLGTVTGTYFEGSIL